MQRFKKSSSGNAPGGRKNLSEGLEDAAEPLPDTNEDIAPALVIFKKSLRFISNKHTIIEDTAWQSLYVIESIT